MTFSQTKWSTEMSNFRFISYYGQYNVDNEIGTLTDKLKEVAVNKASIVLLYYRLIDWTILNKVVDHFHSVVKITQSYLYPPRSHKYQTQGFRFGFCNILPSRSCYYTSCERSEGKS